MMCTKSLLSEIEVVRREMNDQYKHHAVITPELLELSVKLDKLLNQLQSPTLLCSQLLCNCKV